MIIRHDLNLVFVHVPKCAGKEIRDVLVTGAAEGAAESLFNYAIARACGATWISPICRWMIWCINRSSNGCSATPWWPPFAIPGAAAVRGE